MPVLREIQDWLPSVSPVITRPWRWAPLLCWLPSMTLCWCVRHSILSCKCRLVGRTEHKTRNNSACPLMTFALVPAYRFQQYQEDWILDHDNVSSKSQYA